MKRKVDLLNFYGGFTLKKDRKIPGFRTGDLRFCVWCSSACTNMDMIFAILRQPKANQQEKIVLKVNDIRRYFPQNYTTIQMTSDIMKGLELLRKQRARSKDAR